MDQTDLQGTKRPKDGLVGSSHWGMVWGFAIVLVGVALLLDHMGVLPFGQVYRFWPLILVLFGLMNLSTQSSRGFGIVLIVAGAVLQLKNLGLIHLSFADLWPLAIIAVGLLLIWGSLESRGVTRKKPKIDWTAPGAAEAFRKRIVDASTNTDTSLNAVAIFGNCERRFTGRHFQGGKATSIFGGMELDFRDADIDDEAVLEVSCVFGGVEIRVPETWYVHSRSLPVFGGFEDKTRQARIEQSADTKRKTLIVTGLVVFGGVEIMN
jgi:predicted membrane protein